MKKMKMGGRSLHRKGQGKGSSSAWRDAAVAHFADPFCCCGSQSEVVTLTYPDATVCSAPRHPSERENQHRHASLRHMMQCYFIFLKGNQIETISQD